MATEKRYTNGIFIKSVKTTYGQLMNVSISESGLKELQENQNKGYVNITFAERREADKYGNTHYSFYNDYKPELKQETTAQPEKETESDIDLPF